MNPFDERHGLPSASYMPRIMACPGSWNMEREAITHLPPIQKEEIAIRGELMHSAYAGDDEAERQLTGREQDLLATARRWEGELFEEFFEGAPYRVEREKRQFLHHGTEPISSGRFDVCAVGEDGLRALILDLKTGWDDEMPVSRDNWQLKTYAVILNLRLKLGCTIGVAILAPNVGRPVLHAYGQRELDQAERAIKAGLMWAKKPDALRTPGMAQCKYCAGAVAGICPEARTLTTSTQPAPEACALSPEDRGARIELLKLGIKLAELELDGYKSLLAHDPESVAGYQLKPGALMRPVTDPARCYAQASEFVSAEEMLSVCEINKSDLEELVRAKSGRKGKALRSLMGQIYEGCVTEKQKGPTLEKCAPALTDSLPMKTIQTLAVLLALSTLLTGCVILRDSVSGAAAPRAEAIISPYLK